MTVHMTLITQAMFQLDPWDFNKRSKEKKLFHRMILNALREEMDLNTLKEEIVQGVCC